MLGDGKLNSLDTRLEQFKLNNTTSQNELQGVLRDYAQLIEDYKTLKQSIEDSGNGAFVSNTVVTEKPRNPYVLVLIDGNGYIFNDELVRDKEEGGMRAARMLNDAVEKYLRESLPQSKNARVIVRIYADLTNLSKQLAKSKLTGLEKRSLAPFAAAFTRAINLFDFVDALDEEGTKFKLRETFKLAAEDDACSHILYAACHDSGYLSQLVPYSGHRDKITLVQGAGFSSEFHHFALNVTQFPTIFRWSELSTAPPLKASAANTSERNGTPTKPKGFVKIPQNYSVIQNESSWRNADNSFGADDTSHIGNNGFPEGSGGEWSIKPNERKKPEPLCKYFQKGFCRFGNKCKFQHIPNGVLAPNQNHSGPTVDRSNISSVLPTHPVSGFIPLNKDGQRIDIFIPPPTQEDWIVYNARFHRQKPCNDHHLQGSCTKFSCPFDHNDLEPQARHCLEYVVKCSPCPRKGACRSSECFYGHLCQKNDCLGQMKGCRMKGEQHSVDPMLASMVPAEEEEMVHHDGLGAGVGLNGAGEMSAMW